MKWYIMRGGIIINSYPGYEEAAEAAKSYPGSIILKECYTENRYGAPANAHPFPDYDSILDEDYDNEESGPNN